MEPEKKLEKFHAHGFLRGLGRVPRRLGDKWSMLVLLTLNANGAVRVSARYHRTLGDISHRTPTVTLRMLETDGMIRRVVDAEVPPLRWNTVLRSGAGSLPAADFRTGGMGRGEQGRAILDGPQEVLNDIRRASVPSG